MLDISFLIKKNGAIDGKKFSLLTKEQINEIEQKTAYLINPTLAQRIKAIKLDISKHDSCKWCNTTLRYSAHQNKMFNTVCSCEGYRNNVDNSKRIEQFKKTVKNKKDSFEPKPIFTIEETKKILLELVGPSENQYSLMKIINSVDGLRESLFYHVPNGKIGYKVALLTKPHSCTVCGEETRFFSIEKGFNDKCQKHAAPNSRIQNKLNESLEILKNYKYEILNIPDSIQDEFSLKCEKGHVFTRVLNNGKIYHNLDKLCPQCFPVSKSKPEYEIKEFLELQGIKVIHQYPIEKNKNGIKKIDLYLPEYKLGIEYNGLVWHSFGLSKHSMFNNKDEEDKYHLLKRTEMCAKQGIKLIHIFSNEWKEKKDLWLSMILSKCGKNKKIYGRKCKIIEIDNKTYNDFTNANHMQGSVNAAIKYGLTYENKVVAIASFSKNRFSDKGDYELIRFCTLQGYSIIGGFSKLIKHFSKNYPNNTVISYANKRWSFGNVYEKNNFIKINDSSPNYWYVDENEKIHSRIKFQRHKLNDNSNKTESEIMFERGFRRLWDCGNIVYKYMNC